MINKENLEAGIVVAIVVLLTTLGVYFQRYTLEPSGDVASKGLILKESIHLDYCIHTGTGTSIFGTYEAFNCKLINGKTIYAYTHK